MSKHEEKIKFKDRSDLINVYLHIGAICRHLLDKSVRCKNTVEKVLQYKLRFSKFLNKLGFW